MSTNRISSTNSIMHAGRQRPKLTAPLQNFGPHDPATERKRQVSRRLRGVKVTLPVFKCLQT
jgi:hypothetical protein